MIEELHGIYHRRIPDFLVPFCKTAPMQRLRRVGMNCGCEYTAFPLFQGLAPYSRFDHSLGTALIVWHFTGDRTQAVAGLLHDIATPVFAHVVDFLDGDPLNQQSTESRTAELIEASPEMRELLEQNRMTVEEVADAHRYPVSDNESPRLSADRLEYTFGNLLNYEMASLSQLEELYRDLITAPNEEGTPELCFQTKRMAVQFAHLASRTSEIYVADEDRFSMRALSELLERAIDRGVLTRAQLWETEPQVIGRLQADPLCKKEWAAFCGYLRILRRESRPEKGDWVQIATKRRWIDPMIREGGRVSAGDADFRMWLEEFQNRSFDSWLSAQ